MLGKQLWIFTGILFNFMCKWHLAAVTEIQHGFLSYFYSLFGCLSSTFGSLFGFACELSYRCVNSSVVSNCFSHILTYRNVDLIGHAFINKMWNLKKKKRSVVLIRFPFDVNEKSSCWFHIKQIHRKPMLGTSLASGEFFFFQEWCPK